MPIIGIRKKLWFSIYIVVSIWSNCLFAQTTIHGNDLQKLLVGGQADYTGSFSASVDPFGFLWVASRNGLFKYEGDKIKKIKHSIGDSLSLPSNSVYVVHSDNTGNIYTKCMGHPLSLLLRKNDKVFEVKDPLLSKTFDFTIDSPIITDSQNLTWFGTRHGLCRCKLNDKQDIPSFKIKCEWPVNHPLNQLEGNFISNLLENKNDQSIWISNKGTIVRYNPNGPMKLDTLLHDDNIVSHIFQSKSGVIYVLRMNDGHLLEWKEELGKFDSLPGINAKGRRSFKYGAVGDDNRIWVSELGLGIHVMDSKGVYDKVLSNRLNIDIESKYLRKPVLDRTGNIWWPGGFLYKVAADKMKVKHFQQTFGGSKYISAIYKEENWLWMGTLGGGLLKYNMTTNSYFQLEIDKRNNSKLPDQRIYSIQPFDHKTLLLLTRGYLLLLDKISNKVRRYSLSSGPVRSAVFNNEEAFVTHSSSGIWHLNFATGRKELLLYEKNGQKAIAQTQFIHKGKDEILWLCTLGGGLVKFDLKKHEITSYLSDVKDSTTISSNNVVMLAEDDDGNFWIATDAGLNIFNPINEKFEFISSKDGLTGDLIDNVIIDDEGFIWVSADAGMNKIDAKSKRIKSFHKGSGFENLVYYPRSIYKDAKGTIYVGGREGLDIFDPQGMTISTIPPKVWITKISRNVDVNYDNPIENVKEIVLSHTEINVNIAFASSDYVNPEQTTYEYRLIGADETWKNLGTQSQLSLVGLNPGNYILEINGISSAGIKSTSPARLSIVMEPPFYNTGWFYFLLLSVTAGIIILYIRHRVFLLKKDAQIKRKLAEKEMQALRSQMNPHFIFNSLNSIKSFIIDNNPRTASNYLTKFAQLMRHILNHSKVDEITLEEEIEALELYIELEQIRFSSKFTYEKYIDPNIQKDNILIQPLIIQPFVENAIWHGLMHLEKGGVLMINILDLDAFITIEIIDNGIGRKRSGEIQNTQTKKQKSHGMNITKERLAAKYLDNYKLEIFDKDPDDVKATGTVVKLTIPKIYK